MSKRHYPRTRSSTAIAASLYAPLIEAIATGITIIITALGRAIASVIRAIRKRPKGDG